MPSSRAAHPTSEARIDSHWCQLHYFVTFAELSGEDFFKITRFKKKDLKNLHWIYVKPKCKLFTCGTFYKTEYGQRIDLRRGGGQDHANLGSENSGRWRAIFIDLQTTSSILISFVAQSMSRSTRLPIGSPYGPYCYHWSNMLLWILDALGWWRSFGLSSTGVAGIMLED